MMNEIRHGRFKQSIVALMMFVALMLSACGGHSDAYAGQSTGNVAATEAGKHSTGNVAATEAGKQSTGSSGQLVYAGAAFEYRNNNVPTFSDEELTTQAFEHYSDLDGLGRCGVAYANICEELMPTEERESIGMVKPSGWQTAKYQGLVDGNYLYNRCHLIGFQLAGENANEKNLITGTRFMNVDGMLPFENQIADFVKNTGYHVLYRVTPVFEGNELVARGVLMEAKSVEDKGAGLSFNVYVYNVQPGVIIDYASGNSRLDESFDPLKYEQQKQQGSQQGGQQGAQSQNGQSGNQGQSGQSIGQNGGKQENGSVRYVLNTNSNKFHYPDCKSVKRIKGENRKDTSLSREILIERGFAPCGVCNP